MDTVLTLLIASRWEKGVMWEASPGGTLSATFTFWRVLHRRPQAEPHEAAVIDSSYSQIPGIVN